MAIPGVLLAAGASCRFGQNKLLMPFREHTVLYHAVKTAVEAPLDPVVLVLGYEPEQALVAIEELRYSPKLRIVHNTQWELGRTSSLQVGLRALPLDAPGAVVLLGDMPLMTSQLIARVVRALLDTKKLCFPVYRGSVGRPVALPRELFGEFEKLSGDESGLQILQKYWEGAVKLELAPDEEPTQWDVDTPEDLEQILRAV
jgi:molybdenum cofactor cytidylyltransferase